MNESDVVHEGGGLVVVVKFESIIDLDLIPKITKTRTAAHALYKWTREEALSKTTPPLPPFAFNLQSPQKLFLLSHYPQLLMGVRLIETRFSFVFSRSMGSCQM